MKLLFVLIGFLSLTAFRAKTMSDRLCKDNEEILFSFLTKNGKVASLCKDKQGKYLVYRFGTKEAIELEYPNRLDETSWKAFTYYGVWRGGGKENAGFGELSLSFTNSNVKYQLFQNWRDEEDTYDIGVKVTVNGKEITLKGSQKSQKGSLMLLNDEQHNIKNTFEYD